MNEALVENWLDRHNDDGGFKGSITIAQQDPAQAVAEIERWAGHPHIVQVTMDSGARIPFGQRYYHPIYDACQRHGLVLHIHPGTDGMGINHQPTPGYPTHYIEWHSLMSVAFQAHLTSILTEGVFERFPGLRLVMVEAGVAWVAPLLWRLDSYWKALRSEVPWVKRPPSEYVRDHVRFSTQPIEEPDDRTQWTRTLQWGDAEHVLMFATDYPHWDGDYEPKLVLRGLPKPVLQRIGYQNALDLYGLPPTRPA